MNLRRKLSLCYIANPNNVNTHRWLGWFVDQGHEVTLIAEKPVRSQWSGVKVLDLTRLFNIRVIRYAVWAPLVKRWLRQLKPDILHAHQVSSAGWLGAYAGYHPFVVTSWGSDLFSHPSRSRLARALAPYVLRRADLVTVNSRALEGKALEFGARGARIQMIQWGVELDIFHTGHDPVPVKEALGIGGSRVVLSLRAVAPVYNIDTIIDAVPTVLASVPGVVFLLLDYNTDPAYKSELEHRIDDLGIRDHIRWVGPITGRAQLAQLYCTADLVLSVPSTDSTPASVLESMACARPVICTDLPSLHEWIDDGENGIFVPVRDAPALAQACISLLKSPDQRQRLGSRSRAIVEQRADRELEMGRLEGLYHALLEDRHA